MAKKVPEVITSEPCVADPSLSLAEAARLMKSEHHAYPVWSAALLAGLRIVPADARGVLAGGDTASGESQ